MTYVMSDLHGEYRKFLLMLEKINFRDSDILYILGDIVDRGPEPVKLIQDLMKRHNVYVIMGNHDLYACDILKRLMTEINDGTTGLAPELFSEVAEWMEDGGFTTLKQFQDVPPEERTSITDFISELPLVEIYETDERCFIMSHAGLGNFSRDKKLKDYTFYELLFARPDPYVRCFEDETVFVVCGHTPTVNLCGENRIYHSEGNIFIDCGAVFGGKLGCLCLDSMEEFYI